MVKLVAFCLFIVLYITVLEIVNITIVFKKTFMLILCKKTVLFVCSALETQIFSFTTYYAASTAYGRV